MQLNTNWAKKIVLRTSVERTIKLLVFTKMADLDERFKDAVVKIKEVRVQFERFSVKKNHFELLQRFDALTYDLFGLYQQAVVGNINVPKRDYMDPLEKSWMHSWMKGNKKWHAWNKYRGMSNEEAKRQYVDRVDAILTNMLHTLEQWKDEMDPRIPCEKQWTPEEEREQRQRYIANAKRERRQRDQVNRQEEQALLREYEERVQRNEAISDSGSDSDS